MLCCHGMQRSKCSLHAHHANTLGIHLALHNLWLIGTFSHLGCKAVEGAIACAT
jgi:hypothetical protein